MDLELLSDTAALDAQNPSLRIYADNTTRDALYRWHLFLLCLSVVLVFIGAILFLQTFLIGKGVAGSWKFSFLPSYGLVYTLILTPVVLTFYFVRMVDAFEPNEGLWVLTSSRRLTYAPGFEPLVLRIDSKSRWFFNHKPVSPERLRVVLMESFSRRPDWVVYLDVNSDLEYGEAAHVVDVIRGLQAKVILVTPGMRSECCK